MITNLTVFINFLYTVNPPINKILSARPLYPPLSSEILLYLHGYFALSLYTILISYEYVFIWRAHRKSLPILITLILATEADRTKKKEEPSFLLLFYSCLLAENITKMQIFFCNKPRRPNDLFQWEIQQREQRRPCVLLDDVLLI